MRNKALLFALSILMLLGAVFPLSAATTDNTATAEVEADASEKSSWLTPDAELKRIARYNAGKSLFLVRLSGDYGHALFCAVVERNGWFERRVPSGTDPSQASATAAAEARRGARPLSYVPKMDSRARLITDDSGNSLAVGRMFSPDPAGSVNPLNPAYRPRAKGTVPCFCYSRAKGDVLSDCPENPDATPDA